MNYSESCEIITRAFLRSGLLFSLERCGNVNAARRGKVDQSLRFRQRLKQGELGFKVARRHFEEARESTTWLWDSSPEKFLTLILKEENKLSLVVSGNTSSFNETEFALVDDQEVVTTSTRVNGRKESAPVGAVRFINEVKKKHLLEELRKMVPEEIQIFLSTK